jgi:hypothetical protein
MVELSVIVLRSSLRRSTKAQRQMPPRQHEHDVSRRSRDLLSGLWAATSLGTLALPNHEGQAQSRDLDVRPEFHQYGIDKADEREEQAKN